MERNINPTVKSGDRIILYYMDDPSPVSPGTKGTVTDVVKDPFENDGFIVHVTWDDGRTLSLVSVTDVWKKLKEEKIDEQTRSPEFDFFLKNPDIFEHFNWRFLKSYLTKIRDSGIINMFAASPLLYCGKEHIDRYYGEGKEDDESFQEVLNTADKAKDEIVNGVVSYMTANNKDLDNMDMVNRFAKNFAQKIIGLYITFP